MAVAWAWWVCYTTGERAPSTLIAVYSESVRVHAVKTRVLGVGRRGQVPGKPILCSDRFHQSANAENARYSFHVVCQDVQRHFGTDVSHQNNHRPSY
jgi:hypothetical protein